MGGPGGITQRARGNMNYYFEISESCVATVVKTNGRRYRSACGVPDNVSMLSSNGLFRLAMASDRVWAEDETNVRFCKNRFIYPIPEVDLMEFAFIKLQCQPLQ